MSFEDFLDESSWKVPNSVDKTTIRDLLRWVGETGINDLKLKSDYPPMVQKGFGFHRLNTRNLSHKEVVELYIGLKERESADSVLQAGEYDDFNYYLPPDDDGISYGFRICATGCRPTPESSNAIELVLRTIPGVPPTLKWNKLHPALEQNLVSQGGLIMVCGMVANGKTTLLASTLRELSTKTNLNGYTVEDPCEYDLSQVPDCRIPITQLEVGKHLKSFSEALRVFLRKSPHFAMYGESRDTDSIRHMGIASETGITVYTTVHSESSAEAIPRMVRDFPVEEQDGVKKQLITQTRLIVFQRLLEKEDGSRAAVREFVILNRKDRASLMDKSIGELPVAIREIQAARKTDYAAGLHYLFQNGDISRELLDVEMKRHSR